VVLGRPPPFGGGKKAPQGATGGLETAEGGNSLAPRCRETP